jgi:histidinol-phosphate aminotransferase
MITTTFAVREAIRELEAYELAPRTTTDKLDQNEAAYDWPDELKDLVTRRVAARPWNRYPDFELRRLRTAIANSCALRPENVLVGNGSNELLLTTLLTFVTGGVTVVAPVPTFPLYEKLTRIAGGNFIPVPLSPTTGRLPVRELTERSRSAQGPALIIVCSPNNPTGGTLADGELGVLLDSGAMIVLDRAYAGFDDAPLPPLHPRLITLGSFSKSAALAGLRIGWLASTEENCRELRKVKLPYSLNIFSEEAAIVALENDAENSARIEAAVAERERLRARLTSRGIEVFPSKANFLCFRTTDAARTFEQLAAGGILVRDVSALPLLRNCLRVSIGTPEQNDRFLTLLEKASS